MAERAGFEPADEVTPINGLASRRIRPLCHLSDCTRSIRVAVSPVKSALSRGSPHRVSRPMETSRGRPLAVSLLRSAGASEGEDRHRRSSQERGVPSLVVDLDALPVLEWAYGAM